jgi:hypothetical protein
MRNPFRRREEEDILSFIARATYVGSAERAWPKGGRDTTLEENRALLARTRRWRAKAAAPK